MTYTSPMSQLKLIWSAPGADHAQQTPAGSSSSAIICSLAASSQVAAAAASLLVEAETTRRLWAAKCKCRMLWLWAFSCVLLSACSTTKAGSEPQRGLGRAFWGTTPAAVTQRGIGVIAFVPDVSGPAQDWSRCKTYQTERTSLFSFLLKHG